MQEQQCDSGLDIHRTLPGPPQPDRGEKLKKNDERQALMEESALEELWGSLHTPDSLEIYPTACNTGFTSRFSG